MVKTLDLCPPAKNTRVKAWPYEEYYFGDKDEELRKTGQGEHHWSGAESQEWYTGRFLRDTMHGAGDYRWRFHGHDGYAQTYEGYFYANHMHGYGTMSYPDGSVFRGLFHSDYRWGPGVTTHITRQEDVGLWRGSQLIRLAWRPPSMSIVPDLLAGTGGTAFVEPHRVMLASCVDIVGETNIALELLKHYGVKPAVASRRWPELYPRFCTDTNSALFHKAVFDQAYYRGKIHSLKECTEPTIRENMENGDVNDDSKTFFAWNNSDMILKLMKHSFTHEAQRKKMGLDLISILSGHRKRFKAPGKHELECRTLLLASYLGDIPVVTSLINQCNVHPNVADMQGNTALMYAVCGDQTDVINFLVDAGASVDSYNDACCTAFGIALMRLAAVKHDVSALGTVTAMIPPQVTPAPKIPIETTVSEWNMLRNQVALGTVPGPQTTQSKIAGKTGSMRKIKSVTSLTAERSRLRIEQNNGTEEMTNEKQLFTNILNEFEAQVHSIHSEVGVTPIPYIFESNDMVKEIDAYEDEIKKPATAAPKKTLSKVMKDTKKSSKILLDKNEKEDVTSVTSAEMRKRGKLDRIMLTILHLLQCRAAPALVRCPQPALSLALASGNAELVKYLVRNGADVNENLDQMLGYSPLEKAVSRPLNIETIELVRSLLECGAMPNRRLPYSDVTATDLSLQPEPGPTLLHAVLVKKTESFDEEEIRNAMIDLLLQFGCDANALFKGRSAIELTMTKSVDVLDVFIKNSKTDLDGVINDANQSILVKMFTVPYCTTIEEATRLQILTNLLLYGADPFIECQNGNDKYANLFVYAKKILDDMETAKPGGGGGAKADAKGKSPEPKAKKPEAKKPDDKKKEDKLGGKSMGKMGTDVAGGYRQALDLVTECARMLRVRWIQGKLVREMVGIVDKYKHRAWHMVVKEHKNQKKARLWLTSERCLEIWDILSSARRRVFRDGKVLQMLLCIVQYYSIMDQLSSKLTFKDKERIETAVSRLLSDRSLASRVTAEATWIRCYVQPELMRQCDSKFDVCFECCLPITEESIQCVSCRLVSFCNLDCVRANVDRSGSHPCNERLKAKYFPTPPDSLIYID